MKNMKQKILPAFLFIVSFISASNILFAQTNRAFAVTGEKEGSLNWIAFREIDLSNGSLLRNIYIPVKGQEVLYDALSKIQIPADDAHLLQDKSSAALTNLNTQMVAAIAFDAKYNRLYFTLMKSAELRYIDLNSTDSKIYAVKYQSLKPFETQAGETDVITRMTFGVDGYGYALTNSSNHLLRFTTGQKIEIKDLGSLKEGDKNGANSVHTPCQNWGGDLVGGADGNLYLFSMRGNIFKINTQTMVADFAGTIKNLPDGFNVNAAAIDGDGNAVVSSAVNPSDYYRVNLKTFEATAIAKKNTQLYNASDFANSNFAFSSVKKVTPAPELRGNANVTVYPNPVTNKTFTVQFTGVEKNNYTIELSDMAGKKIFTRVSNISGEQDEKIILPKKTAAGMYILRVLGDGGKQIYTDKIVID